MSAAEVNLSEPGDAFAALRVPEYGDPETILVSELRVGDFVVEFPAQGRIRGAAKSSGAAAIEERFGDWVVQNRKRGPKFPVASRRISFIGRDRIPLNVPPDCEIVVRRPTREGEA